MTSFIREAKRQLCDIYGLTPSRVVEGDEPCFDDVPDGLYEMKIDGKTEYIAVIHNKFYILDKKEPKCPPSA